MDIRVCRWVDLWLGDNTAMEYLASWRIWLRGALLLRISQWVAVVFTSYAARYRVLVSSFVDIIQVATGY